MNVVFYRPFAEIWFKNPTRRILKKERLPNKYEGLFDYLANSGCASVSTSLMSRKGLAGWLDLLRDSLRLLIWAWLNRINPLKVKFIFTRRQFEKADAVLFMHYGCFTHESKELAQRGAMLAQHFSNSKVKKIVHLTHYLYNPSIGAENLAMLRPDLLVAENDLSVNSKYYQKYFEGVAGTFYHLPYVASSRFQNRVAFDERSNKLGVTGSITYKLQDPEFLRFFGQSELQPMRRKLYEQRDRLSSQIDCHIFDLDESRRLLEASSNGVEAEIEAKVKAAQRNYYSTDIVAFFNSYMMFAVPEEVCDLPAISFIEGMACGAAYFGIDDPMYRSIGMVPGFNYVAYDGTVDGLLKKVAYYQAHRGELKVIAERGWRFAHEQMSGEQVYSALQTRIAELVSGQ